MFSSGANIPRHVGRDFWLSGADVAKEGGILVREFKGIVIGADLRITLKASPGSKAKPVLGGVEFAAEQP